MFAKNSILRVPVREVSRQEAQLTAQSLLVKPAVALWMPGHEVRDNARKIHLGVLDGPIFCGTGLDLYYDRTVEREWLNQADPDNILCKRCRASAVKFLEAQNADD